MRGSCAEPKQAAFLSTGEAAFQRGMNGAYQAALNIIIMKWMHLVSEGFIHKGNDEEVISLSADLLGTLREESWSQEAIKRSLRLASATY